MATEETSQKAEQQPKQPNKIEAALQRFSEMLIQRMEEMQRDWKKGWVGGGTVFGLPQNFSGRTYEPEFGIRLCHKVYYVTRHDTSSLHMGEWLSMTYKK